MTWKLGMGNYVLGAKFWSRYFWGSWVKPNGFLGGFNFFPIRSSLSLEIQSTPLGSG